MDPKELFIYAVGQANGCVKHLREDEFGNKTPCSEWNLKELLNHMVYELLWVPELLQGKTVADIGDKYEGDVLGENPVESWQKASKAALAAVKSADLDAPTHLSYADVPASRYITEMGGEMLIHGWDLGQSINCSIIFEEKAADAAYKFYALNIKGFRDGGFVGKAVAVADDAPLQTKLLALMGRRDRD